MSTHKFTRLAGAVVTALLGAVWLLGSVRNAGALDARLVSPAQSQLHKVQFRRDRDRDFDRDRGGRHASCDTYASIAVLQSEANDKYNCRFGGPQWNTNARDHYEWCMTTDHPPLLDEMRSRAEQLQRCFRDLDEYDRGRRF